MFDDHAIPCDYLIFILMHSCDVMQGSNSGLETKIHVKALHLLDIDGDSYHHIHNFAKKFCKPFNGHIEKYFIDIFSDFE